MNIAWLPTMLLLSCPLVAQEIDGMWIGKYEYGAGNDTVVVFSAVLTSQGDVIIGKMIERNTFGHQTWRHLSSDITGEVDGNRIKFFKRYDGTGLQNHVVVYTGVRDGDRITGEWDINGGKGPFSMRLVSESLVAPGAEKPEGAQPPPPESKF